MPAEPDATVVNTPGVLPLASHQPFERGDPIGRYLILGKLGAGGMGVVYSAYDPDLSRRVAIKVLREEAISQADGSLSNRTALLREAQAMAQLSHPNVLPVYDVGTVGDRVFIATEYVEGRTLKQWNEEKRRPWRDVLNTFVAAGRGLWAAHRAGLIHRDFKPHNVMVGQDGAIRVMDFGLARLAPNADEPDSSDSLTTTRQDETSAGAVLSESYTVAGTVMGTPAYMAPEQHAGEGVGPAADQYAFCVALWEGLYGQRPFQARQGRSLAQAKAEMALRPLERSERAVPRWLKRVVLRGLSPEPADRWPSMDALLQALQKDPTRRARRIAGVSAAVALAAGWGLAAMRMADNQPEPCGGSEERAAAVWNAETRARLRQGLLATGRPHAKDVANRLSEQVERYMSDWTNLRTGTCRATRVHREQSELVMDRKMACLDGSLEQVSTYLDALAGSTNDNALNRATVEFQRLASLEFCKNAEALARQNEIPIPEGEEDAVAELDRATRRLKALCAASVLDQVATQIERVEQLREQVSHAPSRARATWIDYMAHQLLGRSDRAKRLLEEVRDLASQYDDKSLMVWVWSKRLWTVAVEERHMHAARELVAVTEVAVNMAKDEPDWEQLRAEVGHSLAAFELLGGDLAAAERRYREVAELEGSNPTAVFNNLGIVLIYRGKIPQAREAIGRAERYLLENVSGFHPALTDIHLNRGLSHHWVGELAEAEQSYREAIDLGLRSIGKDSPRIWLFHLYLGHVLTDLGRWSEASSHLDTSFAGFATAYGPESEFAIHNRVQRARIALGQGNAKVARQELDSVLEVLGDARLDQLTRGYTHPLEVDGMIALVEGDRARARRSFEHALEVYKTLYEPGSLEFVDPLIGLAQVERESGRMARAEESITEVLARLDEGGASRHDLRRARALEIRAHLRADRDADWEEAARRALEIWNRTAPRHPHAADMRRLLEGPSVVP